MKNNLPFVSVSNTFCASQVNCKEVIAVLIKRFPVALMALAIFALPGLAQEDWLNDYIKRPEPKSGWTVKSHDKEKDVEVVCLDMTSQVWRGITWKHRVWIYRSTKVSSDISLLLITGGRARREKRFGVDLVLASGGTVAILDSIPNQPLFNNLREDDLIAHTFLQYFKTGEKDWPLLLPMTKSAVKAMDAIEEFSRKTWPENPVKRFVPTGGSKRGWTTWLTGIADKRVAGIVPIVYDNLNVEAQMKHQIGTWGKYSQQIDEYTKRGIQKHMGTPRGIKLGALVDPYSYRHKFQKLPKLLINATNDAYWTLDALNLYWDGIGSNKNVLYVPNQPHGIRDIDRVVATAGAFVRRLSQHKLLPQLTWKHKVTAERTSITVDPKEKPLEVRVWVALSDSKDFRKARWKMNILEADEAGRYATFYETPDKGYKAFFVELKYGPAKQAFTLSTAIKILGRGLTAKKSKPRSPRLY
jgi:PhoPQ-activated pathogenicity-related protein